MLLTSAVESLAVSLGVVAFNLTANVVSAAVVATVTTRFLKTSYANVFSTILCDSDATEQLFECCFFCFIKASLLNAGFFNFLTIG